MFNIKFVISISIFVTFLVITSTIKNKTRVLEKKITSLSQNILIKKKIINEAQLEFYYLSSPLEIEKRLKLIGFDNYQPIAYSRIYLNLSNLIELQKKMSNLDNTNEKKVEKK